VQRLGPERSGGARGEYFSRVVAVIMRLVARCHPGLWPNGPCSGKPRSGRWSNSWSRPWRGSRSVRAGMRNRYHVSVVVIAASHRASCGPAFLDSAHLAGLGIWDMI
jgi:hypothetical protein